MQPAHNCKKVKIKYNLFCALRAYSYLCRQLQMYLT